MFIKEATEYINKYPIFDSVITEKHVRKWAGDYELRAKKIGRQWDITEEELIRFFYRVKQNKRVKRNKSFIDRTKLTIMPDVLIHIAPEQHLFRSLIAILVTLDPEALFYDSTRQWELTSEPDGGIVFHDTTVLINRHDVTLSEQTRPAHEQTLSYAVITAQIINGLCNVYSTCGNPKSNLFDAARYFTHNRMSRGDLMEEASQSIKNPF